MNDCRITTSSASQVDAIALVHGHLPSGLPKGVRAEAARLDEHGEGPVTALIDERRWIICKLPGKDWLIGGEDWRHVGAAIAAQARAQDLHRIRVDIEAGDEQVQALVEGAVLGDYRYTACRSGTAAKRETLSIALPGFAKAVKAGQLVARCQNLARELADMPPNLLMPAAFVSRARRELRGAEGVRIATVSGVAALEKAGFPGLVHVGKGSTHPPALLSLRYRPKRAAGGKDAPRLALVGKGITFDSGGISLKPGQGMWEMKADMGGAAATLAAFKLIVEQKLPIAVDCFCALAENMPDGKAQRPGDIYRTRKGHYVHVDNTDAEGRLVMADVLTYACEEGATHLVDAATLTGACLVALGSNIAGVMSRHADWAQAVRSAGQGVGEEFWELPLYGEYRQLLDHPHADLNNIGGRFAGTITAGLFLSEFVDESVRWAHCDIAGPAMQTGGWRYFAKGMTGFGARSFARLAADLANQATKGTGGGKRGKRRS